GHGVTLEDHSDGFHGAFRMLETPAGETALALVREGVLSGASVECRFHGPGTKSVRGRDGVVRRIKAKLMKVALCREPAYSGAIVLGVRTLEETIADDTLEFEDELRPLPFDADLAT